MAVPESSKEGMKLLALHPYRHVTGAELGACPHLEGSISEDHSSPLKRNKIELILSQT